MPTAMVPDNPLKLERVLYPVDEVDPTVAVFPWFPV
jgi:hypothetical protein